MSAENTSIKRRKIDDSVSKDAVCCLTGLPKEALIHVATFLAAPSRALFAASLDGSPGSSDENISAIFPGNLSIGSGGPVDFHEISAQLNQDHVQKILWETEALNQTDILDFGKISKELVVQLSDDGIKTILLYVDAVNTVKRLKLANCINITGHGLEPLRGSTMIVQIDLSLDGDDENPRSLDPEPPISCNAVLPILDSIISRGGCALKHLLFPYKWERGKGQQLQQFEAFVTRYNQMLRSRVDVCCLKCNENLPQQVDHDFYFTCYECLKQYCTRCGEDSSCFVCCCHDCGRQYCQQHHERLNRCDDCGDEFCVSCGKVSKCSTCDREMCRQCATHCYGCDKLLFCSLNSIGCNTDTEESCRCCECGTTFCNDCKPDFCWECEGEGCHNHLCNECNKKIGTNTVTYCEDCDSQYCGSCRVRSCQKQEKEEGKICTCCIKLAHPFLIEENKILIEENKNFRRTVAELKDVINKQKRD